MRRRSDDVGQLQLLESILVAVFIFVSIAVVAVYRLPTNPSTFEVSELQNVGVDTLKVRQAKVPGSTEDCNETPCPFGSDLDRIWSLALGYRGPTVGSGESPATTEFRNFLDQALPPGSRYLVTYSNGYNETQLFPRNATPPAADVVVARTVSTPNWTVNASFAGAGTTIRLGELTGFPSPTVVADPLGRVTVETGASLAALFAERVPMNATLGTYNVCDATTGCAWVDIVPPGMPGPGSYVLDASRELPSASTVWGRWDQVLYYNETDGTPGMTSGDVVYLSRNVAAKADDGDIRLTRVANCRAGLACAPGSTVRGTDSDASGDLLAATSTSIKYNHTQVGLDEAVGLVIDVDNDGIAREDDILVTRQGNAEAGSASRYTGDATLDYSFAGDESWIVWWDHDGDGARQEGEPMWLNLTENAQTENLEAYDVVLVPGRLPPRIWPYDVKVVIWYGV